MQWCYAVFALVVLAGSTGAVLIDNTKPRLDVNGEIIDAHDGTIRKIGDWYYYHGAAYSLCQEPPRFGCDQTADHCGFQPTHNVSIYRSKDLSSGSWEFRGYAAHCTELPDCKILYRPHLVFNPNTNLYVLFVNYVAEHGYGGYAVLTSPNVEGPFQQQIKQMNTTRQCPGPVNPGPCGPAQGGTGDFDVFVDKDGTGYLIYSGAYYMSIEELTPDFLHSTGKNASCGGKFGGTVFPEYFIEAPTMFERNGIYYALFDSCCCFCFQGSGVIVHTAPHPMGPWTVQPGGDLACRPASPTTNNSSSWAAAGLGGVPTPGQGCLYHGNEVSVTRSQQNVVFTVETTDQGTVYVWTGDRWQQAPDHIKGHEGQFWAPLVFHDDGSIANMSWIDSFTLNLKN